ncbi:MAG TPA: DnaJ domain-containing protein [Candidatus Kapabacteria bacterium]|nr:DnaJ domain-containing protein [Candidatus Kapabacteria bacterium]
MKDYFSILGLPRYASEEEIKEAYRRLALRWHPDLNAEDEESRQKMQDLNHAKEVLFEADTRAEYKKLLDTQDALSYENLQRIRKKYRTDRDAKTTEIDTLYPSRRKLYAPLFAVLALLAAGLVFFMKNSSGTDSGDPIKDIIERHNPMGSMPQAPTPKNNPNPADSDETIERIASVSAMMGDYKTAVGYWEYLLSQNKYQLSTAVELSLAYIKLKDYPAAFDAVTKYVHSPNDKLIVYVTLGDYFKSERQPFDAQDVYKKALELIPNVDTTGAVIAEAIARARAGIVIK